MKILFLITFFFLQNYSQAIEKAEFCEKHFYPEKLKEIAFNPLNLMSFKNSGGIVNGGVCWWHSRFQRNALYLTNYFPENKRKSDLQFIKKQIHEIRKGLKVVNIDGFNNFEEYTKTYQREIQAELEAWQIFEGVVLGTWTIGLKGNSKTFSANLERILNSVFENNNSKNNLSYLKLQIKGIVCHAWLILKIEKTESGYLLTYLDSNYQKVPKLYEYRYGDSSFYIKNYGHFVPYLENTVEENRLKNALKFFCLN